MRISWWDVTWWLAAAAAATHMKTEEMLHPSTPNSKNTQNWKLHFRTSPGEEIKFKKKTLQKMYLHCDRQLIIYTCISTNNKTVPTWLWNQKRQSARNQTGLFEGNHVVRLWCEQSELQASVRSSPQGIDWSALGSEQRQRFVTAGLRQFFVFFLLTHHSTVLKVFFFLGRIRGEILRRTQVSPMQSADPVSRVLSAKTHERRFFLNTGLVISHT